MRSDLICVAMVLSAFFVFSHNFSFLLSGAFCAGVVLPSGMELLHAFQACSYCF